jgi:hypothetical protein
MPFTSNGRGTLVLKRVVRGLGEIRRASGTHNPGVLASIIECMDALELRGDLETLRLVKDGVIRPIDLLPGARSVRPLRQLNQLVYCIQSIPSGNVKIGIAENPAARLRTMQTGTWEELVLLWTLPGGADLERRLHRRFADYHIAREWFRPHPAMLGFPEIGQTHPGSAHPGAPTP